MSKNTGAQRSRGARWGWGILLVESAVLVLNGIALYFISGSPSTFEGDTGVALEEVRAAFPSVAEQIIREGQLISVMLIVVGLMSAVAAWAGFRRGHRWAWAITGIMLAMLVYFAVRFMLFDARADIGGFYIVLALVALVGQVLSGRRLADGWG